MNLINKYSAVKSLCPTVNFIWVFNPKDGLDEITNWDSPLIAQPTEAEITAEVTRLQAEYDNKEYQRQRAAAYPSIADQLDTIYHSGIDAWKETITAVKEAHPK